MATIEERVATVVAEHLGLSSADVTAEKRIREDLGADSLDRFEIVMAIEDEFVLEIPDEDVLTINTIAELNAYVTKRRGP